MNKELVQKIKDQQKDFEFEEETHSRWYKGIPVISVTQLLRKHGIADDYSMINDTILKNAQNRGIAIHKDIENWFHGGELKQSEGREYVRLITEKNQKPLLAEFTIGNEIVAGQCDMILEDENGGIIIDDHKTGSKVNEYATAWQNSLYAYLGGFYDKLVGSQCSWLPKGKTGAILPLEIIPIQDIEELLECESLDLIWQKKEPNMTVAQNRAYQLGAIISNYKSKLKELQSEYDMVKERILSEMQDRNVLKIEFQNVKFTRVRATQRESIDTTRLKEEMPEIAKNFIKIIPVAESLRVKIGGTDNEV